MNENSLAQQFAQALQQSTLIQSEKEDWALFSGFMNEEQVQECIALLQQQTTEAEEMLDSLKKKIEEEK